MDARLHTHLLSYQGSQCSLCESLFSQALRPLARLSYVSRMREMGRAVLQSIRDILRPCQRSGAGNQRDAARPTAARRNARRVGGNKGTVTRLTGLRDKSQEKSPN